MIIGFDVCATFGGLPLVVDTLVLCCLGRAVECFKFLFQHFVCFVSVFFEALKGLMMPLRAHKTLNGFLRPLRAYEALNGLMRPLKARLLRAL